MKALIRDRILGIDASGSQMGNYSPGNMLDDSTRNVWISSQYNDNVTLECNTQVNSFFIGNVRSDDIRYSYFKNPITATSGQIENEGTDGGGDYVHFQVVLDGNKTGDNRPFSEGDNLRVRLASHVASHIESSPVEILFEDYDSTNNETTIYCRYQYDINETFSTEQSIKNTIHGIQINPSVKIGDNTYTTFKFPTVSEKSRFLIAEDTSVVTETYTYTVFYDGPSGSVTATALADFPTSISTRFYGSASTMWTLFSWEHRLGE